MTSTIAASASRVRAPDPVVRVLHPGDVACGAEGDRFATLLGSCVAIVLTDPRRTLGAMCHIVHSGRPGGEGRVSSAYAGAALATMYALLRARGLNPSLCDAWVVGGGNMFPALLQQGHVGEDNVAWVLRALDADGIRVLSKDVGGNAYRRLAWTVGRSDPEVVSVPV
jgi:chemotaxis protein CheD